MKIFKGSAKHGVFQVFSFFGICTLMCSAFIGILISSGWLAMLSTEGKNKTFLIPLIIFLILVFLGYKKTACNRKLFHIILYIVMSLLISAIFMLYIFIPWWLPSYSGGPLLP